MAQGSAVKFGVTGSMDWVREQASRRVMDGFVREVFPDRVIIEDWSSDRMVERSWSMDGDGIALGEPREVSLEYVAKAEGGPRLAGPFVAKDEARRLVYGAVLVPGEPDSDGETLTAEKIEEVAHTYLESFRAIDVQHEVDRIDASPVESYIEPADREVEVDGETVTLPAGTWTMAVKVYDDDAWADVVAGKRAGFSIMGVPQSEVTAALEAVKSHGMAALKRTTLADIGGGDPNGPWVAPFVSLVDQPAVPKAKFYAIKQQHVESESPGWLRRLFGAGKEGRRYSKSRAEQVRQLKSIVDELVAELDDDQGSKAGKGQKEELEMTPEQVSQAVKSAVDEALKPINERLDKVDPPQGAGAASTGKSEDGGAGDGAGGGELTLEAIGELIDQKLQPVAEKAEQAEKRTRPGSQQTTQADDSDVAMKGVPMRDPFGRRLD